MTDRQEETNGDPEKEAASGHPDQPPAQPDQGPQGEKPAEEGESGNGGEGSNSSDDQWTNLPGYG